MSRLFNLNDLLSSEEKTVFITRDEIKGFFEKYPKIINVFIQLSYFSGETENVNNEKGVLQSFCHIHYVQAPYTSWSIYNLYEKGYYLECIILYRHLLEAFIQMKYFNKYPQKLEKHIIGSKRISFKKMFDEFSEGFYKTFYGKQLSGAAHGMLVKDIFRFERKSQNQGRVILGCEYDEDKASYVMNNIIALTYGFLNNFPIFFDKHIIKDTFKVNYEDSLDWLKKSMDSHKKVNPKSIEWYKHMNGFIELK